MTVLTDKLTKNSNGVSLKVFMKNEQFWLDMGLILISLVVGIVFALVFVYMIPNVSARVAYDETKMQNTARANTYHQYLIRKGVISE